MYQRVTEKGPDQEPSMSDPGQLINALKRIMERLKTYIASLSTHARLFFFFVNLMLTRYRYNAVTSILLEK